MLDFLSKAKPAAPKVGMTDEDMAIIEALADATSPTQEQRLAAIAVHHRYISLIGVHGDKVPGATGALHQAFMAQIDTPARDLGQMSALRYRLIRHIMTKGA